MTTPLPPNLSALNLQALSLPSESPQTVLTSQQGPAPQGTQAQQPGITTPQVANSSPIVGQNTAEQQREIFRQKMMQNLERQAQPPKNRGEAILRNMIDVPLIGMDIVLGLIAAAAGAGIKKMGWLSSFNIQKPWKAILWFPVLGLAFRAAYSAITGKVPSQEGAQRRLEYIKPTTATIQTTPVSITPAAFPGYSA